jgi:hypothetical protein
MLTPSAGNSEAERHACRIHSPQTPTLTSPGFRPQPAILD